MTIYKGGTKLFDVAAGSADVKEVYVGGAKVFPEAGPTITLAAAALDFPAAGGTVSLTATVTGAAPLEFHWQEFVPGGDWATYEVTASFQSSRAITVSGTQYRCVIRDAYYPTNAQVVSNAVTGTLHAAPVVSTVVDTNPITEGQTATFTCTATGYGAITYQWYYHIGDSQWVAIAGATAATYQRVMALAENGWVFTCNATDALGQLTGSSTPITMTVNAASSPIVATGGTISESGGFRYHTFLASGDTFEITALAAGGYSNTVNLIVVAGGGSGGHAWSGGGGAGGANVADWNADIGAWPITVGAGGAQPTSNGQRGNPGGNSVFGGFSATGGGGGGGYSAGAGGAGGSGGGGYIAGGGAGAAGQGNNGGNGSGGNWIYDGGGGGKGGVGGNGRTSSPYGGGHGGAGYTWLNGGAYAGGGGGWGEYPSGTVGQGQAGGGNGAKGEGTQAGGAAAANSGSGGGGGAKNWSPGGAGGSGIVMMRYAITVAFNIVATPGIQNYGLDTYFDSGHEFDIGVELLPQYEGRTYTVKLEQLVDFENDTWEDLTAEEASPISRVTVTPGAQVIRAVGYLDGEPDTPYYSSAIVVNGPDPLYYDPNTPPDFGEIGLPQVPDNGEGT